MKQRPLARPHPLESWAQHLANGIVVGTGLLYAWMKYLLAPEDPWAVINHPWQPTVQHLHVLGAPLLLFATGVLWQRHIAPRLNMPGRKRFSGVGLLLSFVPMAASGYLLQVSVDDDWRRAWLWVHLLSGGLWSLGYLVHQLKAKPRQRAARRRRGTAGAVP